MRIDAKRHVPSFLEHQRPDRQPSLVPVVAVLLALNLFALAMWVVR